MFMITIDTAGPRFQNRSSWLVIGETELLLCNLHIDPWPLFWPLPRKMVQSSNYPSSESPSTPYPWPTKVLDSATVKLTCFKSTCSHFSIVMVFNKFNWRSRSRNISFYKTPDQTFPRSFTWSQYPSNQVRSRQGEDFWIDMIFFCLINSLSFNTQLAPQPLGRAHFKLSSSTRCRFKFNSGEGKLGILHWSILQI